MGHRPSEGPGLCLQLHPAQDGFEERGGLPISGFREKPDVSKPLSFSRFAVQPGGHGADKLTCLGAEVGTAQLLPTRDGRRRWVFILSLLLA